MPNQEVPATSKVPHKLCHYFEDFVFEAEVVVSEFANLLEKSAQLCSGQLASQVQASTSGSCRAAEEHGMSSHFLEMCTGMYLKTLIITHQSPCRV